MDRTLRHVCQLVFIAAVAKHYMSQNPLHFSLPPELNEESLMRGTEQLSRAILESDPQIVRSNHDLHAQLTARQEKLEYLIRFINDNGALGKVGLIFSVTRIWCSKQSW
jgi:nuclear pore complex protein Nup133